MQHDITPTEARDILKREGGYGETRIYFTYPASSPYVGQIGVVKSEANVQEIERDGYGTLYAQTRGNVPIRRA